MANIDVISLIFESFELIRARYKEVAVPLMVLLLISGAGHIGGSSLSDLFGSPRSGSFGQDGESSLVNAMPAPGGLLDGLAGDVFLALVAFVVALAFAFAVIILSVWFYISEHFHSVLIKKKITQGWQARIERHMARAFVMALFEFALLGALVLCVVAISLAYPPIGLIGAIAVFALLALVFICIGFFLIPAWMYYAIDRLPFFTSLSRSFSLVRGSMRHFLAFAVIFAMLGIGSAVASFYACCFSFIISPVLAVFFALLSRVTLLKMKNAMEPAAKAARKK